MLSYACSWFSIVLLQYNVFLFCTTNSYQQSRWLQISSLYVYIRWPSSVQNKIKIVFAAYISKAQNTTCTIWLLCYKYFVHFSDRRLSAFDVEKTELRSVIKMTILIDSFVPLHALLFWLIIEVVNARFILNNKLWNCSGCSLLGRLKVLVAPAAPGSISSSRNESSWSETLDDGRTDRTCFVCFV